MLRQAQHERDGGYGLASHSSHPAAAVTALTATVERDGQALRVMFGVEGRTAGLQVASGEGRTDGLWKHTCFEAFVADEAGAYREFNFAPSGAWATYAFDSYRAGMRNAAVVPAVAWDGHVLTADVMVDVPGDWRLNLTAVIEETDGTKSYWALAHPDGPPDFHDPACFVLTLPAADPA